MHIVTYHSANAKPEKAWLAYIVLMNGDYWGMRFSGPNEQYVIEQARARWEIERQRVMDDSEDDDEQPTKQAITKRGSHIVGKVWLRQKDTNKLIRVFENEVDKYLADGYYKSGPRQKTIGE